jgi:hypothetical protein
MQAQKLTNLQQVAWMKRSVIREYVARMSRIP